MTTALRFDPVQRGGSHPDPRRPEPDGVIDDALVRLTDQQRAADAVDARRREQALRQQSAESGSFGGALTDLAERGVDVVVSTVTGRQLRGAITSLGPDHVLLRTSTSQQALVAVAAITAVRSEPGGHGTVGDRETRGRRSLTAVLADMAAERPAVVVHLTGGEAVAGILWSAGQDLLCVRANDRSMTYVAMGAIGDLLVT